MKLATLGPEGTYSSQATRQYDPEAGLELADSIAEAIGKVATGECRQGVVPIENSIEGIVTVTFDELFDHNLLIRDELVLDIHHTLAGVEAPSRPTDVQTIYSHPQALAQSRRYLARHYPEATIQTTASTAAGMETIAADQDRTALAIGPDPAVDVYGLVRVDERIEDEPGNQTRFVAFSKESEIGHEQDFIMLAVVPEGDQHGLIHGITGVIDHYGVNLSDLHSRPMRSKLGSHKFYMRLDLGSRDDRYEAIAADLEQQGHQVVRMSA